MLISASYFQYGWFKKLEHKDRKLLSLTFMFHEAFAETFSGKEVSARGYFDFRTSFYRG